MTVNGAYSESENKWLIDIAGEVDIYNVDELRAGLLVFLDKRPCSMVLNCANLEYIDSTGLGVLVSTIKKVRENGGKIEIKNLKPYIYKIFELTNLNRLFDIEVPQNETV